MPDLTSAGLLVALGSIAFGLLNCFFGYRVFRFLLGLYGLIFGAAVGGILASNLADGQILWVIVGAAAGGLVGAALFTLLYFVGVFLVGAAGGVSLAIFIGGVLGMEMPLLVIIIVALVVGIIALILQRSVLILATAFWGARLVVGGAAALITGTEPVFTNLFQRVVGGEASTPSLIELGAWLALDIGGTLVQFATTREGPEVVDGPAA